MRRRIDRLIEALVLIRFGQELGADSQATRALHDILAVLSAVPAHLFR